LRCIAREMIVDENEHRHALTDQLGRQHPSHGTTERRIFLSPQTG
jgi:hypothetical protein